MSVVARLITVIATGRVMFQCEEIDFSKRISDHQIVAF